MNPTLASASRGSTLRRKFAWLCLFVSAGANVSFTVSLPAATLTWSSSAANGTWSSGTNWLGGTAPGATTGSTNIDTAWFSGGSTTTVIVPDANRNLQNLSFDGSAAYTIGTSNGNALLMTSAGTIQMTADFSGGNTSETINAPLVLEGGSGASYTLADNATNAGDLLSLGGPISGTATAAGVQTLNVTGNGGVAIGGVLSDGGNGGSLALSLLGNGLLTLNGSAANLYSGPTQIGGGTLALSMSNMASPTNLISSNSSLVLGGGALLLSGKATGASMQTFNGTTVNAGASAVTVANNGGSGTTLALGAITRNVGGTVNFTLPGGGGAITTSASNSNGILGGWAIVNGTDWAAVSGGSIGATASYSTSWSSGFNTTVSGTVTGYGPTNSLRFTAPYARVNLDSTPTVIQSGGILVTNSAYGSYINDPSGSYMYTLTSASPDLVLQVPGPSSQLTINATVSDNGLTPVGLTIAGSGSVTLYGASTFTGPVNLDSGTLTATLHGQAVTVAQGGTLMPYANLLSLGSLAGSGTISGQNSPATILVGQNNASTTFSGVFYNFNNLFLTKVGQGTLTLSGSNSAVLSGHTILNGSTLVLDYSSNAGPKTPGLAIGGGTVEIIPSTTTANLVAGNSLELPSPGALIDSTLANNTPYSLGGAATIAVANVSSSASIALGSISRVQGTSINFVLPANFTGHLTTTTPNYDGILGGFATVNGVDWATNSVSGGTGNIVAYTGYPSFVKSGASNAGNYLLSGSSSLSASESMNSLKITDSGAGQSLNLGSYNLSITAPASTDGSYGGAILYAGGTSNSYTINGTGLILCGTNANYQQLELLLNAAAGTVLTINAPISGQMPITKAGGGTVVLGASNGYTGGAFISAGKLVISSSAALGTSSSVSVGPGGTFDVNGCALNGGIGLAGSGYDGNGALINSSTATASFNNTYSSVTFNSDTTIGGAGNIQFGQLQTFSWGTNTLTKVGSGTLSVATPCATLSAANTLLVNGGKFQYQANDILGSTAVATVNAGATLNVNGYSDVINQLTLNNGTALLGSGTSSFVIGQYTSPSNKPVYGSLTATGSSSITGANQSGLVMASGSIDVVGTTDVLNLSAPVIDQGWSSIVIKTGSGSLVLSGSNTYSGATTITSGTLQIGNGGSGEALASSTIADSGTLAFDHADTMTYAGAISGNGNLVKFGSGMLALSGSSTYSGSSTISAGTLNMIGASRGGGSYAIAGTGSTLSLAGSAVVSAGTLSLGSSAGSGTVQITGGSLTAANQYVGNSGAGVFNQTGGINTATSSLYLGYNSASSGSYSLSGTGQLSVLAGNAYVGYSGSGGFTQSGGNNTASNGFYVGYNAGSSGSYTLNGNSLFSAQFGPTYVGDLGTGNFNQSGGTAYINSLSVGGGLASSGTYSLSGNSQLSGATLYLGSDGTGSLMQSGGSQVWTDVSFGSDHTGIGTYSLSGTGKLTASYLYVGQDGTGNFNQTGGTVTYLSILDLAEYSDGSGTYSLSGTGQLSAANEYVGLSGPGNFTQSGGTNTLSTALTLGLNAGSNGIYSLSGGLLVLPALSGGTGTATFNFSGGTLQASGGFSTTLPLTLAVSGSSATFDTAGYAVKLAGALSGPGSLTKVDSGTLTLAATNSYSGSTLVNGGTLALGSGLALQDSTLDTSGSGALSFLNLTSGTFGGLQGSGNLALSNTASAAVALSVGNNNTSTTFSGALSGPGNLTKIGLGSLLLTGSSSYAGPTTVMGGTLRIGLAGAPFGAVAHYPFDGNANDVSGNGNNGTLVNSPAFSTGRFGQAVVLNGTNQYVTVPYSAGLALNAYTVSTWVDIATQPQVYGNGGPGVISTRNGSDDTFDIQYEQSSTGTYKIHGDIGNGTTWLMTSADYTLPTALSGWNMITYAVNSSGYLIYMNGVLASSGTVAGGTPLFMKSGQVLSFGTEQAGLGEWYVDGAIGGSMDDTAIFGSVLNATQIGNLYIGELGQLPSATPASIAAGAALDLNGASQTVASLSGVSGAGGTVTNSASAGVTLTLTPSGGSTSFNGTILGGGTVGSISLVLGGSGTQVLAGSNTYSGSTTIGGGTLQLGTGLNGQDGSIGGTSGLTNNSALIYDLYGNQVAGYAISGSGSLTKSGGGMLVLSGSSSYSGSTTVSAGTLNITGASSGGGSYAIAGSGSALTLASNAALSAGSLSLGSSAGSGTVQITGGSLTATNQYVGNGGTGVFNQTGGTNTATNSLYLGYNSGGNGAFNLSGTGMLSTYGMYVGYSGTGNFTQTGGSNAMSTSVSLGFWMGYEPSSMGTYNLSNSMISGGTETVGYLGTGVFTQSSGTNTASALSLGAIAGGSGTYNLNGGLLVIPALTAGSGTAAFNFSGGTLQASGGFSSNLPMTLGSSGSGAVFNTAGYAVTLAALSGTGGLSKIGGGTLTLGGANTYTGNTAVSAGTLNVSGVNSGGGAYAIAGPGSTLTIPSNAALSAGSLSLGSGAGSGILQMTGGSLYAASYENVGDSGAGTFNQSGGTNSIGSVLYLGNNAGSSGTYNLSGGSLLAASNEVVGNSGTGTFTQTGGTNGSSIAVGALSLGGNASGGGTYNLSSGQIFLNSETVGAGSTGLFSQTGGTNTINALFLANSVGVSGTYSLSGGLLAAPSESVGNFGTGTFNQTGGANNVAGQLSLGYFAGSSGTYTLSGSGQLSTTSNEAVGLSGTGTFAQTGGTNSVGGQLSVSGTYTLSGSGRLLAPGGEYVGAQNTAAFTQTGGTNTIGNTLYLGYAGGTYGTFNLGGSGQLSAPTEYVGNYGAGIFTQTGGTNTVATALTLTSTAVTTGSGTYDLNGGLLILPALTAGSGTAAFNFSGGTLQAGSGFSTSVPMTLGGSGGSFDTAGYAVTLTGALSGTGSLTKVDSGTLTLATANSYGGNTLINGGTLTLGSGLALQNSTLDTSGTGMLSFLNLAAATFGGMQGSGNLALSNTASAAVALSVGNNNANTTYSGSLGGPGALTKIGTGTLTLSNTANAFTGNTTVSSGTLAVTGQVYPGSSVGSATINSGATLQVSNGGQMFVNLNTNKSSAITVNAGGNLLLNSWAWGDSLGTLYFQNGNVVVNGGTISTVGNSNAASDNGGGRAFTIGAAGATLDSAAAGQTWSIIKYNSTDTYPMASNGGLLTLTGPGNGLFGKNLPGAGGLAKAGAGVWTLTGSNTYTGPTTVASGVLAAAAANTLSASSAVTISGGTLDASGYANSVASLNLGSGGCLNLGLGNTLSSSGAAIFGGALNVSGAGTLGNYPLITYASESSSFASISGLGANYLPLYNSNGTELDALHKAQVGTLTVTAANPAVITGGTTSFTVNVANSAPAGSDALNFTASASGAGYGLGAIGSAAAQNSGNVIGGFSSSALAPGNYTATVTVAGSNSALSGAAINSGGTQSVAVTVWDHSNASLSPTAAQASQSINFGNVLKGAAIPSQPFTIYNRAVNTSAAYTANLQLTGVTPDPNGDPALSSNLAAFNGLQAGGSGASFTASLNTANYTTTGITTITLSASQLADDSALPGAGKNNSGAITVTLQGNVGNAAADASNSPTAFGSPLTAPVAQNASYANLESTVTSTTGSGGQSMFGSTARILAGAASVSTTASMAWRTAAAGESLVSDVVDLSGIGIVDGQTKNGSVHTDTFVLQMTYSPSAVEARTGLGELASAEDGLIQMDYLDEGSGGPWQPAVLGDFGSTSDDFVGVGAWNSSDMTLGDWGVNTVNHTVWAVLDHNSQFAVVPEPSTLVLLGIGALVLMGYRGRRRPAIRTAQAESQDDASAILAFPSHSHPANVARRAA